MTLQEIQALSDLGLDTLISNHVCGEGVLDFTSNMNTIREAEELEGLLIITNRDLRVKWVNNLRRTLERDATKNKSGTALISDVDLLLAPTRRRAEAFALTFCKP